MGGENTGDLLDPRLAAGVEIGGRGRDRGVGIEGIR